jgi:glutaminyl-tRNA synthetase
LVNPHSLEVVRAKLESSLAGATCREYLQFERLGYFVADSKESAPGRPVFNRTISLKDTWAKPAPARSKPAFFLLP